MTGVLHPIEPLLSEVSETGLPIFNGHGCSAGIVPRIAVKSENIHTPEYATRAGSTKTIKEWAGISVAAERYYYYTFNCGHEHRHSVPQ